MEADVPTKQDCELWAILHQTVDAMVTPSIYFAMLEGYDKTLRKDFFLQQNPILEEQSWG